MLLASNESISMKDYETNLEELFPDDAQELLKISSRKDFPLGYDHPSIFLEDVGIDLDSKTISKLRTAYVMISAYYFLLDAVVDKHLKDETKSLYLTHLLSGSVLIYSNILSKLKEDRIIQFQKYLFDCISKNAYAVGLELKLNESTNLPFEIEYESIVGRSNSFYFLYYFISLLAGKEPNLIILKALQDLVFYFQLGDDLGDWREDFNGQRMNSFLRIVLSNKSKSLSENELEHEIYLSGIYEQRAATIINGFDSITESLKSLENIKTTKLESFIRTQRDKVYTLLEGFVSTKLQAINTY